MPADQIEVRVERNGVVHGADIVRLDGTVVKLQSGYISPEEVRNRESFYGKMVWLFDARDAASESAYTSPRLELRPKSGVVHTFRWKHPSKHMGLTTAPAYLDVGSKGVFLLNKLHLDGGAPYGGWGKLKSRDDFIRWLRASK